MRTERLVFPLDSPLQDAQAQSIFVLVWAVLLDRSCVIYIHDSLQPITDSEAVNFGNLSVTMNHPDGPISSQLIRSASSTGLIEEYTDSMARRVSMKLNLQVFVSSEVCYVREGHQFMEIEKKIVAMLKAAYPKEDM
jgi:hypothetical protein